MEYDFDYLKELYKSDPEEFKRVTDGMIKTAIDSLPTKSRKQKLERKQWRIDHELNRVKNPTERLNRMVKMFWDGVDEFSALTRECKITEELPDDKQHIVIDFKKKDDT